MRKIILKLVSVGIVLAFAVTATGAPQVTEDQGRRLAGPFCIGKKFLRPLTADQVRRVSKRPRNINDVRLGLAVLRAGAVRSVAKGDKCRPWENLKPGVAVVGTPGPRGLKGDDGARGPAGAKVPPVPLALSVRQG